MNASTAELSTYDESRLACVVALSEAEGWTQAAAVSPPRKSFLRVLTGTDLACIGPASLAAELFAACQGGDFIRTHNVAAVGDALTIFSALAANRVGA
ncbi:MAG: dihydropteroate synthase type 2 [Kribbellaceae bacterium]|nr:dihydropteroate synthase type 2 [Kribbellaceae bacterium]